MGATGGGAAGLAPLTTPARTGAFGSRVRSVVPGRCAAGVLAIPRSCSSRVPSPDPAWDTGRWSWFARVCSGRNGAPATSPQPKRQACAYGPKPAPALACKGGRAIGAGVHAGGMPSGPGLHGSGSCHCRLYPCPSQHEPEAQHLTPGALHPARVRCPTPILSRPTQACISPPVWSAPSDPSREPRPWPWACPWGPALGPWLLRNSP